VCPRASAQLSQYAMTGSTHKSGTLFPAWRIGGKPRPRTETPCPDTVNAGTVAEIPAVPRPPRRPSPDVLLPPPPRAPRRMKNYPQPHKHRSTRREAPAAALPTPARVGSDAQGSDRASAHLGAHEQLAATSAHEKLPAVAHTPFRSPRGTRSCTPYAGTGRTRRCG
jgi:hypothetical protein